MACLKPCFNRWHWHASSVCVCACVRACARPCTTPHCWFWYKWDRIFNRLCWEQQQNGTTHNLETQCRTFSLRISTVSQTAVWLLLVFWVQSVCVGQKSLHPEVEVVLVSGGISSNTDNIFVLDRLVRRWFDLQKTSRQKQNIVFQKGEFCFLQL